MKIHITLSQQAKEEVAKAEKSKNKQRLNMITRGFNKINQNPLNPDNIPHGLPGYFCEKASGQLRVFYEFDGKLDSAFISWINPVEFPHDTNNGQDRDPSYNEFKRLLGTGKIEVWVKPSPEEREPKNAVSEFVFAGEWGENYIYTSFSGDSDAKKTFSSAMLALKLKEGVEKGAYSITDFIQNFHGAGKLLLAELINHAKGKIEKLSIDLYVGSSDFHWQRVALEEMSFQLIETDGVTEFWEIVFD